MTYNVKDDYWQFWERFDRAFIEWADCLAVLQLDGWNWSKGVAAEIAIAESMGKPITFTEW